MSAVGLDGSEEGGEGYFASVSDLMVGILFVFLLMLTVFALNFRDTEDEQKVARAELIKQQELTLRAQEEAKRAQEEAARDKQRAELAEREALAKEEKSRQLQAALDKAILKLRYDLEYRQALRTKLLNSLAKSLADRDVQVKIDPDTGILRVSGDLLFEKDKSELLPKALARIGLLGEVLATVLPCYTNSRSRDGCAADSSAILDAVLVEGHTDRQPYKQLPLLQSQERNDQLSTDRALSVFKRLWQGSFGLENLKNDDGLALLGFSGYGERRPLPDALGSSGSDHERNRRIDLRFVLSPRTSEEFDRLQREIDQLLGRP